MINKHHNLNPSEKKVGDCVVRAISYFLNKPYLEVYDRLCAIGREHHAMPNDFEIYEKYLNEEGYEWTSHTVSKGDKRPKVRDFKEGKHLLRVANHLTVVENNVLYDTWDCSGKAVYRSMENRKC